MKKLLLSTSLLMLFGLNTHAQLLNAGFENWHQDGSNCMSPDSWGTLNGSTSITGICTANKDVVNYHGGSAALALSTEHIVIFPIVDQLAPGIVTNGTINTQTEAVEGGQAFTERPSAFTGWYEAFPVNNDQYSFEARLINEANGDTVGYAEWSGTSVVNSFSMFSAPVTYTHPEDPTLLQIILLPSNPADPQENSLVIFDDLGYEFVFVGVSESELSQIRTYPNPVVDQVFFNLGSQTNANVALYNVLGVKILDQALTSENNSISMQDVVAGTYVWQMANASGQLLKTGKVLVIK